MLLYISGIFICLCFFSDCGEFIANSGFEKIVFAGRMCSVGGIKPILSIEKVVAEAIDRVPEEYVAPLIWEKLVERSKSVRPHKLEKPKESGEHYPKNVEMQKWCIVGEFGVSAKQLMFHVRIGDLIFLLHSEINTNDFYLRN